eukprot:641362-Pelagomonas_calceolata.AAC.1
MDVQPHGSFAKDSFAIQAGVCQAVQYALTCLTHLSLVDLKSTEWMFNHMATLLKIPLLSEQMYVRRCHMLLLAAFTFASRGSKKHRMDVQPHGSSIILCYPSRCMSGGAICSYLPHSLLPLVDPKSTGWMFNRMDPQLSFAIRAD